MVTIDQFEKLSREEQKQKLSSLKDELGVAKLAESWGITKNDLHNKLREFAIPIRKRNTDSASKGATAGKRNTKPSQNKPVNNESLALHVETKPSHVGEMSIEGNSTFVKELLNQLLASPAFENSQIIMTVRVAG